MIEQQHDVQQNKNGVEMEKRMEQKNVTLMMVAKQIGEMIDVVCLVNKKIHERTGIAAEHHLKLCFCFLTHLYIHN